MERYIKNPVSDVFRKINALNEISQKAQEADLELTKIRKTILEETKEGLKEVEHNDDRKDFMTLVKEAIGQTKLEVKFKKLDERAVIPTYAHEGDVGMDMTAIDVEYDKDGDFYIYHTGLAFETDKHYGILMFPRSSNRKTEAYLCNHVGVADSAIYRGEIIFCFKNRTSLRQHALEGRMISFFNAIEHGESIEDAVIQSVSGWTKTFKDPMLFAPYKVGDRIGQMVVIPYPNVKLVEHAELSETERGDGAFGSTDKKQ